MKTLPEILLEGVYTKQDAYALLDNLMQLERLLYSTNINMEARLNAMFSEKKTKEIISFLKKEKIDFKNPEDAGRKLLAVQSVIKNMPVIMIQLAIEPTSEILNLIIRWFEKNSKQRFLLDIQVNKSLIGGLVISKQGLFKDYSVRREFDCHFSSFPRTRESN